MRVWVLEGQYDGDTGCDGTSVIGVFSTKERAWGTLSRYHIGPELAATITWTMEPTNEGFWEGHNFDHTRCYLLVYAKVDEETEEDNDA